MILKKNKRAISTLVSTVLIILITVAAVGIIWGAIMPVITRTMSIGQACLNARVTINTEQGYTYYDGTTAGSEATNIMISHGSEEFELAGINLILKGGGTSKTWNIYATSTGRTSDAGVTMYGGSTTIETPLTNEDRTYAIDVSADTSLQPPETASVAPIVQVGKTLRTCSVSSSVTIPKTVSATVPLGGGGQYSIWTEKSMIRINQTADKTPAGTSKTITLYAAKGETESFQIGIQGPTDGLTNVNVAAPNLIGPSTILSPNITLYREHYVNVTKGVTASYYKGALGPGMYPDALIPFKDSAGNDLTGAVDAVPFNLVAGYNQPIWVDVYVPRNVLAGQYTGTFTVTSDQGSVSIDLTLNVWNFELPLKPYLNSSFRYGEAGRLTQPDSELLKNRIMPYAVNPLNERNFIDKLGLKGTNMGFWAMVGGGCDTKPDVPSVSTMETEVAKHQADLAKYNYLADEIDSCPTSTFDQIKLWAQNLHAAGIDSLITMAPNSYLYDDGSGTGRSAVDIWVILNKFYGDTSSRQSQREYVLNKGDEIWSYTALAQDTYSPKWLIEFHPLNYRLPTGFINANLNSTGLLYWRVDYWSTLLPTDSSQWDNVTRWSPYGGEGLLVYNATLIGISGVIPSMRLKYIRDGVDDFDYVYLLKQKGQGAWALIQAANNVSSNFSNWTKDSIKLENFRVIIGNKLNSL
ncbi:DUF4091 domain-containing protein [Candidatus Pacearchaeota archaeon]|nr:DUF4091 domain-containing protein [Candidatus Pacearchaeota archaeon]